MRVRKGEVGIIGFQRRLDLLNFRFICLHIFVECFGDLSALLFKCLCLFSALFHDLLLASSVVFVLLKQLARFALCAFQIIY